MGYENEFIGYGVTILFWAMFLLVFGLYYLHLSKLYLEWGEYKGIKFEGTHIITDEGFMRGA